MNFKFHSPYDVVVVGGGPAGIGATLAAARNGAKTILIEQASFLGGNLTFCLPILTYFSLQGVQILNGIPQEFFDRIRVNGGSPGHVDTKGSWMRTYSLADPEIVKYVAEEMVEEAGANILLRAIATGPILRGDRIAGITIDGKGGPEIVPASIVVDCSGDADIAARAGAPFQKGRERDGLMQATTMMFRLTNVDMEALADCFTIGLTFAVKPGASSPSFLRGATYFDRWEKAVRQEGLWEDPHHAIFVNSIRDGELALNTSRIVNIDGTNILDISRAEVEGRRQVMKIFRFLKKHVRGFERSALISTGPFLGVRETRRIVGEYKMTRDDVIEGREFPDNIARGAFPVDVHVPDGSGIFQEFVRNGGSYGIPFRTLLPIGVENLLVAGRCHSATHDAAGSTRTMGQAMAMGQAAGTAAALAVCTNRPVRQVDTELLRETLRHHATVLEEDDSPLRLEPWSGDQIKHGTIML